MRHPVFICKKSTPFRLYVRQDCTEIDFFLSKFKKKKISEICVNFMKPLNRMSIVHYRTTISASCNDNIEAGLLYSGSGSPERVSDQHP